MTSGQSVTLIKQQRQKIRGTKPGSVAVNHGGLWIPRQQFESAPGYFFSWVFLISLTDLSGCSDACSYAIKRGQDATDENSSERAGTANTDLRNFKIPDTEKIGDVSTQQNVPIVPLTNAVTAAVSPVPPDKSNTCKKCCKAGNQNGTLDPDTGYQAR